MSGGKQEWRVGRDLFGGTHVYDEGGQRLTNDRMNGIEGWEQTAHLIAAAPEMAEIIADGIELIRGDLTGVEWKRACNEWVRSARAIQSRAWGESND